MLVAMMLCSSHPISADVSEQAAIFEHCSKISPSFKALQWPQDKGEAAQLERRSYRLAQAVNDTSPPTARSPCPLHSFVAATLSCYGPEPQVKRTMRLDGRHKAWGAHDITVAIWPMSKLASWLHTLRSGQTVLQHAAWPCCALVSQRSLPATAVRCCHNGCTSLILPDRTDTLHNAAQDQNTHV